MKQTYEIQLAELKKDIGYLTRSVDSFKQATGEALEGIQKKLDEKYVTIEKFDALIAWVNLLRTIVFGMIGLIAIVFFTAAVNFFIRQPQ